MLTALLMAVGGVALACVCGVACRPSGRDMRPSARVDEAAREQAMAHDSALAWRGGYEVERAPAWREGV